MADAGTISASIELSLTSLKASINEAKKAFKGLGTSVDDELTPGATKMERAWTRGFTAISVAAVAASRKVNSALTDMVSTYADFQQSLANTQSVAQATSDELTDMENAAKEIGATTSSTASEAADALYYLASAGMSAEQSVDALSGVNALAVSTNTSLAKTSETVAEVISQYSLQASEATRVANVFTAAITSSEATLGKLAQSFQYVGPYASNLGIDLENTTAALEILYNAGNTGQKAGRALRTILADLSDEALNANKKIRSLGLTFDEIDPQANSLGDIFDRLREAGLDASNAASIFGKSFAQQVVSLTKNESTATNGFNQLRDSVTDTNSAYQAMDVQMDTLRGSFKKFKSAAEAAEISIGEQLAPAIESVTNLLTDFVNTLNDLPPVLKTVTSYILSLVAIFSAVTIGGGALALAITTLATVFAPATIAATGFGTVALGLTSTLSGVGIALAAVIETFSGLDKVLNAENKNQFGYLTDGLALTSKELDEVYSKAKDVKNQFDTLEEGNNWQAFSGDVQELVKYITNLRDSYGLTTEQILKMADKEGVFRNELKETYTQAREIIQSDQDRKDNFIKACDDMTDAETAMWKSRQKHSKQLKADTSEEDDAIDKLTSSFKVAAGEVEVYGDSYKKTASSDVTSTFQKGLEALLKDYGADSTAVQDYIDKLHSLETQYGITANVFTTDSDRVKQAQADIEKGLDQIDQKQKLAADSGEKYNTIQEKAAVVQDALNDLIENNGFTEEGAGIQYLLTLFGKYLTAAASVNGELAEWQKKLDDLNKTQTEQNMTTTDAIRLEEADAIAMAVTAGKSEKLISLMQDYYDALVKAADAKKDLQDQKEIKNYTQELEALNNQYYDGVDALEDQRKAAIKLAEDDQDLIDIINEYYDALEKGKSWDSFQSKAESTIDYVSDLLNDLADLVTNLLDAEVDELQDELDDYEDSIDDLESEYETLADAYSDLGDDTTSDLYSTLADQEAAISDYMDLTQAERDELLAAAIAANDETTADEIETANERVATEEDAEEAIEEAEYKSDLISWAADIITATRDAALAVLQGYKTGGIAGGVALGVLGAAELAAVIAAKPEAPSFSTGGIMPGTSTTGDRNLAYLNAGELILNKAQQGSVASQLTNSSSSNQQFTSITKISIDGKEVAESSAKYYRSNKVKI